jgi:pyruvate/2-oxoglutarate dehydrogenase complex dihydrolipoamide acyltransferase (E2) component
MEKPQEEAIIHDTSRRRRSIERRPFPPARRFITGAMAVGRRVTPMHGLIEVDVTDASRKVAEAGNSFTAFVIAAVGRAAARHPEVHAYRNWRGQLVISDFVDVTALIEVESSSGHFPLAHLIRDADILEVDDITAEIRQVKQTPTASAEGRRLERWATLGGRLPGLPRALYHLMSRSPRMRRMTGTVSVTAVGMLAGGSGHGIGFPTVFSLSVLVGGRSRRPVVEHDDVLIADILDLTVTFDHRVVDGGPAARFVADLREILSHPDVLA